MASKQTLDRRLLENEAAFREYNERVQKSFDDMKVIAREDSQEFLVPENNIPLQFFCECADEKCRQRIKLDPTVYNEIHRDRRRFVILPHHEVVAIEKVVKKSPNYFVVEKKAQPPEDGTLNSTNIDNVSK